MTRRRLMILILGPALIVAGSYWLAMPDETEALFAAAASLKASPRVHSSTLPAGKPLNAACNELADALLQRLDDRCCAIVRCPFVLAGDLSAEQLERQYRQIVLPTARALSTCYFDRAPNAPVAILLCSSEQSYQQFARQLDGKQRPNFSGYYRRPERRIVVNVATGSGTLAHELTHALAHFDFPRIPEWFDEGLAALHEESSFSDDGLRLLGVSNWRLNHVLPAVHRDTLRTLESLITTKQIRSDRQAIDYAHARYFCLYLQKRQLLSHFYRKFRASVARDPSGIATLEEILQTDSLTAVDVDFRQWVVRIRGT